MTGIKVQTIHGDFLLDLYGIKGAYVEFSEKKKFLLSEIKNWREILAMIAEDLCCFDFVNTEGENIVVCTHLYIHLGDILGEWDAAIKNVKNFVDILNLLCVNIEEINYTVSEENRTFWTTFLVNLGEVY